jgi:hypothetical protein
MPHSRAFESRDQHRTWLGLHFVALVMGLGGAFVANRFLTPDTFWAGWVAAGWGLAFVLHLIVFARATLRTMGAGRT